MVSLVAVAAGGALLPSSKLKLPKSPTQDMSPCPSLFHHRHYSTTSRRRGLKNRSHHHYYSIFPVARLFGASIFEASKLKVMFVGVDDEVKHPRAVPRTYTLTHCDITSNLTLAISDSINTSQFAGWYHRFQRDEVVAEWKQIKGKMSLHVHCHISGGHFLLDLFAHLRYHIFCKELPLVLKAFIHGDGNLFSNHPELQEAVAWVYFHSNIPEFNKVECWGPLRLATSSPDGGLRWHHLSEEEEGFSYRQKI